MQRRYIIFSVSEWLSGTKNKELLSQRRNSITMNRDRSAKYDQKYVNIFLCFDFEMRDNKVVIWQTKCMDSVPLSFPSVLFCFPFENVS